ncbi:MAG: DUF935 family protein [Myxococcota bacterium]
MLNQLTSRLPRPARRALTRGRFALSERTRAVRFGVSEWVRSRKGRRPRVKAQRRERTATGRANVPSFEDLVAVRRMAASGRLAPWVRLVDSIIARDGHLLSLMEKRLTAVCRKFEIHPGGEAPEDEFAAEVIRWAIRELGPASFLAHLSHQTTADPYGYAATEIDWVRQDGLWRWANLVPVHQDHFEVATVATAGLTGASEGELLLSTEGACERLIPGQWVVTTRGLARPIWRSGLFVPAAWYSLIKIRAVHNLSRSEAAAGAPFIAVETDDEDLTEEDKEAYKELVENFGQDGGGVLWGGAKVNAVTVDDRMASEARERLASRCDAESSKLFLGASLVDSADGKGSYALGAKHERRFKEQQSRAVQVLCAANAEQLFRPLLDANGIGGATPIMSFVSSVMEGEDDEDGEDTEAEDHEGPEKDKEDDPDRP